jgi:NADH-quinone oxidoreductase subunit E
MIIPPQQLVKNQLKLERSMQKTQEQQETREFPGLAGDPAEVDKWVSKIAKKFEARSQYLIPILQFIQAEAGFLAPDAMRAASQYLKVPASKVYGVASFYAQFYFKPRGKNTVTICRGTACHVRGSARLVDELSKYLGIDAGGTTADMLITMETVACVGACALAPLVVINDNAYGRQTPTSLKKLTDGISGGSKPVAPKAAPVKDTETKTKKKAKPKPVIKTSKPKSKPKPVKKIAKKTKAVRKSPRKR